MFQYVLIMFMFNYLYQFCLSAPVSQLPTLLEALHGNSSSSSDLRTLAFSPYDPLLYIHHHPVSITWKDPSLCLPTALFFIEWSERISILYCFFHSAFVNKSPKLVSVSSVFFSAQYFWLTTNSAESLPLMFCSLMRPKCNRVCRTSSTMSGKAQAPRNMSLIRWMVKLVKYREVMICWEWSQKGVCVCVWGERPSQSSNPIQHLWSDRKIVAGPNKDSGYNVDCK